MTQDGQVFELQTQAHHISDSESLSLPILATPKASEGKGGALGEGVARERGNQYGLRDQAMDIAASNLLPTTRAANANANKIIFRQRKEGLNLEEALYATLPTPAVSDNRGAAQSEVEAGDPKRRLKVAVELLPTTRTSMANGASQKELNAGNPKARLETVTNWGKFEPAIRRWEETIGRPAPAPTKPDGKDGNHRLSSAFTEWMMGLPEGWITDVGLKRNEELKACGNGVVPQQAELALRILLEGIEIEGGRGQVNLPTPTVSDTFTDNLRSTQQKEGSMHSVTLPQAVRMIANEH
jgi:hypothetical protein